MLSYCFNSFLFSSLCFYPYFHAYLYSYIFLILIFFCIHFFLQYPNHVLIGLCSTMELSSWLYLFHQNHVHIGLVLHHGLVVLALSIL